MADETVGRYRCRDRRNGPLRKPSVATLPGVTAARVDMDEVVAFAGRDGLAALMTVPCVTTRASRSSR